MNDKFKVLAAKFTEVASSGVSPVLLMVMGYISNVLLMVYNMGANNSTTVKIVRVVSFAMREFETELTEAVVKSSTPYDDKLIDELFEVVDEVLDDADQA